MENKCVESRSPASSRGSTSSISGTRGRAPACSRSDSSQRPTQEQNVDSQTGSRAPQGRNKHPVWEAGAMGSRVSLPVCATFVSRYVFLLPRASRSQAPGQSQDLTEDQKPDCEVLSSGFFLLKRAGRPRNQPHTRPGSWTGKNPLCILFIQSEEDPD